MDRLEGKLSSYIGWLLSTSEIITRAESLATASTSSTDDESHETARELRKAHDQENGFTSSPHKSIGDEKQEEIGITAALIH